MKENTKLIITFSILIGVLLIVCINSYFYYNYTDMGHCENYMKYNSNLTYGQGQIYTVHSGKCYEDINIKGLGYGSWNVQLEKVNTWIKENPKLR